jgi:hypothetical protein
VAFYLFVIFLSWNNMLTNFLHAFRYVFENIMKSRYEPSARNLRQ